MRSITGIEIEAASKAEILPHFSGDFPHIMTRAEINRYAGGCAPWHWHNTIELFSMESGAIEYNTPGCRMLFPAGSCGMVNAGVLHMSRIAGSTESTVQKLHLFDPVLISGAQGSRIAEKYVLPLLRSGCEIIRFPEGRIADLMRDSFLLREDEPGYELRMRNVLSEIWMEMLDLLPGQARSGVQAYASEKLKRMMVFVHEHYPEQIRVADVAAAAFSSERECYRLFRDQLHCTPLEYITSHRLQMACGLLSGSRESITRIGQMCGFGTPSYFGRVFSESFDCTPKEYRCMRQNADENKQK